MIEGSPFATAVAASFATTVVASLILTRIKRLQLLHDKTDGRPIGGPAFGLGIGCGLIVGLYAITINPFVAGGAGLVFTLGVFDDMVDLSPWQKLVGQSVAAAVATVGIGSMTTISFATVQITLGIPGVVATFFWIITMINAANLIDGLDGLAIGTATPATLGLAIVAAIGGNTFGAILSGITLSGMVGFYPWNRHHARLLLGDTGAELIGYLLAVASLQTFTAGGRAFPIIPSLFLFFFPLADTAFAVVRRVYHHRAVFHGDKAHIHHRLKNVIGEKRAVRALSLLSTVSAGIGLALWWHGM